MMNSGRSLRSARMFGDELQASAAGRLRPAAPLRAPIQNSIFKIHCGLPITARRATSARLFVFGPQPAKGARDCKELRAFAAGGCGPPIAARSISCKKPAAERWACTSEPPGRELQPSAKGAAAGCRRLRRRICKQALFLSTCRRRSSRRPRLPLLGLDLVVLGEGLEPLAVGIVGIRHDDESLRVDLLDFLLHEAHLLAADHQEDHVALPVGVHAARADVGGAAVHILQDEAFELGVPVADNEQQLVVRGAVEQIGQHARRGVDHQQRVDRQQPARRIGRPDEKAEAHHQQAHEHDEAVGEDDRRRELDADVLLQEHRHDVRAARGGLLPHDDPLPYADQQRPQEAGDEQVVRQIQVAAQQRRRVERLDRLGRGVDRPRQEVHEARGVDRRDDRAGPEVAAEDDERRQHQRDVEHVAEGADLHRREDIVHDDRHAVDAARDEIIGVHEEHEGRAHDTGAEQDQQPRTPPGPRPRHFEDLLHTLIK